MDRKCRFSKTCISTYTDLFVFPDLLESRHLIAGHLHIYVTALVLFLLYSVYGLVSTVLSKSINLLMTKESHIVKAPGIV